MGLAGEPSKLGESGEYLGELPKSLVAEISTIVHQALRLRKEAAVTLHPVNVVINVTIMNNTDNSQKIDTGGGDFTANAPVALGGQHHVNSTTTVGGQSLLAEEMEALTKLVTELTRHLSPEAAADANDNLEALKKEAAREKPRQAWYELSSKGLIDAAKAVAGMAAPVTAAVSAVMKILGGST